jgi:hypothetical protein
MDRGKMCNVLRFGAVALLAVFTLSSTGRGQVPPPPPVPQPTLWSFLGIPQGCKKLHGALINRHGKHPKLEKKLPRKALNDPSFLQPDAPAVLKKAAEVKIAEDLAPQKIKAVRYLTKIGCGCYDVDKSLTQALQEAMGDCTERVRLATIEAIADAAEGGNCANCGQVCCCNEDILKTLARIAFERDEFGCFEEPSERVRNAARQALEICCPGTGPVEEMPEPIPNGGPELPEGDMEGPERPSDINGEAEMPLEAGEARNEEPTTDETESAASDLDLDLQAAAPIVDLRPPLPIAQDVQLDQPVAQTPEKSVVQLATNWQTPQQAQTASNNEAFVMHIDKARGMAHVHLHQNESVQVGSQLAVLRATEQGKRLIGHVKVFESFPGSANVEAIDSSFSRIEQGDEVVPVRPRGARAKHVSHRPSGSPNVPRKTLSSAFGLGQPR